MLKGLEKLLLVGGIALSSLIFSCSDDEKNPVEPPKPTPTQENRAPVINSTPITSISEKEYYGYSIKATDPDGDALSYSITKGPAWLTVYNYGHVNGPPPEVASDQTSEVEVTVSDGKLSTKHPWLLTVKNVSNTYLLSAAQLSGATVDENAISLSQPAPAGFVIGDVIGSGITTEAPYGLLREITSVSLDKKILQTKQATLNQPARYAVVTHVGRLPTPNVSGTLPFLIEGASIAPKTSGKYTNFNIKLDNIVLYDEDEISGNGNEVVANGNISFDTDLIFGVTVYNHQIKDLSFKNTTSIESDVTVGSNVIGLALSQKIKIFEHTFEPIVAGYFPPPVPIPIIIVPKLGVYVSINPVNINPLSVNVKQNANVEIGVIYNNINGWAPISKLDNSFTFSNPATSGDLELKVAAGPQLDLMLYGIAGPFADVNGKLRLKIFNGGNDWELYGGWGASAGVKANIIGKNISAQFSDVINYEKLLAESKTLPPTSSGKIAFVSMKDGDAEIYLMNPDGSNQVSLTNNTTSWDIYPSWSPDGNKIVYSFFPSSPNDYDTWIMNSDGSGKTRLTSDSRSEGHPVFSPDGTKIAYTAAYVSGHNQIYIMNSDGSSPIKITNEEDYYYWDLSWNPSQKIACSSNRDNSIPEIYILNSDGSDVTRLTNNSYYDRFPKWSLDGSKIAFSTNRDGNYEIYVMDANGSNQINISNSSSTSDTNPSWSPDGKKIVYVSNTGTSTEGNEIWVMDYPTGLNKKRLTNNSYNDGDPNWSPK